MVIDTLIKCRKYVLFISEQTLDFADYSLLDEIEEAIAKEKEMDDLVEAFKAVNAIE